MKSELPLSSSQRVSAIFDLDGTITKRDSYRHFLLFFLRQHPIRILRSGSLPVAVMAHRLKLRDNSWLKIRFLRTIVGGATRTQVTESVGQFLSQVLVKDIRPGALDAIRKHQEADHNLLLVTASFDFYVEELGRRLGFDSVICSRSVWDDSDKITGEIDGTNCYSKEKFARLEEHFRGQRKDWHTIGYSDHHSDIPLLSWVDTAVAVNPTSRLRRFAERKGYDIQDWEF